MGKFFLYQISLIIFLSGKVYSQCDSFEHRIFKNDSIKFTIVFVSPSVADPKRKMSGRYVQLNMAKECEMLLLKKDFAFWMRHLTNEKEDWATNLVLYYLYRKDATAIAYLFSTREKWLKIKKDEVKYWSQKLK